MGTHPRVTAREAFWLIAPAPAERVTIIEAALERLDALRDRLIGKLDAMTADADLEPSLGFPEATMDQSRWGSVCRLDLEDQCEDEGWDSDREPDTDAEPDACETCDWQDEGDQTNLRPAGVFRFSLTRRRQLSG